MEETLYSRDKHGHVVIWTVSTHSTTSDTTGPWIVKRVWGVEGGKMQETNLLVPEGKVKRTVEQQAELQARSFWNKRKDKGDVEDPSQLDNQVILPMLAHSWDKRGNPDAVYDLQPKLDGVRAMYNYEKGFITRMGKKITSVPHLENHNISARTWLDGELYTRKMTFEELSGCVRRSTPSENCKVLHFHVFDCYLLDNPDATWRERLKYLETLQWVNGFELVPTLRNVHGTKVDPMVDEYMKYGYEGVIARNPDGVYCLNERSASLIKHKRFQDQEYLIVGAQEGKGRDVGTIIWECTTQEGDRFTVRPEGTQEYRRELWANWKEHVGKKLTVRYQELTRTGVPRFPVGVALRDYEA
jgi:DNA ligase-1